PPSLSDGLVPAASKRTSRSTRRPGRPRRPAGPRRSTPRSPGCAYRCLRRRSGKPTYGPRSPGPAHRWCAGTELPVPACPPAPPDPWMRSTVSQLIYDAISQRKSPGQKPYRSPTRGGLRLAYIAALALIVIILSGIGLLRSGQTDPIVGDWNVSYGAPAVVTMTLSGGSYTETAKTPLQVTGGPCYLPVGTIIAT